MVFLIIAIAIISTMTNFAQQIATTHSITNFKPAYFVLPISGLHALLILWLTRQGRVLLAAHFFTGGLNLTLFLALILLSESSNVFFIPYMMLIGIVVIASLDKILASVFYTAVTATAVTIFYIISDQYHAEDITVYLFTLTGVCVTFWLTASDLKNITGSAKRLTREVQNKNDLLQNRAEQLQLSAEISQQTSHSLDLDTLLNNAVKLIRDKFGFYYVSIFLTDKENKKLTLREATGQTGNTLLKNNYQLPIDNSSIVGWVANNQQPYISHNVQQDPIFHDEAALPDTKSELCLPLIARNKSLGVLDIQSHDPQLFQDNSIAIMQIMANQVAVNIDNAQLFSQAESQLNETQTLLDLNTLLTTTLEVGEIYRRAAREFAIKMGAIRCAISSWDNEAERITIQADFVHNAHNNLEDKYIMTYESQNLALLPETQKVLKTHVPKIYYGNDPSQSTD
ncbi:MAG: GAF domain-containing protein, partial [Chloroflexi bacterium]